MKRFHVNVSVENLQDSIRFYSALFAAQPAVQKPDYAKWMLEDPRVNFAISSRGSRKGLDHLGIQVEKPEELAEVHARLKAAGGPVIEQGHTTCCYARSEKNWTFDPQGLSWETFLTTGDSVVYGSDLEQEDQPASACCARPGQGEVQATSSCCA